MKEDIEDYYRMSFDRSFGITMVAAFGINALASIGDYHYYNNNYTIIITITRRD